MWESFQHQDEQQWAKNGALVYTDSHAELLTVLAIYPYAASGISVHALDDSDRPFLHADAP